MRQQAAAVAVAPRGATARTFGPAVEKLFGEVTRTFGGVDVLVCSHGTYGQPSDIALAALWLTDEANAYTTGAVIPVDGGQRAMLPMPWAADPRD